MPRKNSLKIYVKDGFYHIYNRGVEKRIIFEDEQDYKVFLAYLRYSLSYPPKKDKITKIFTLQGLPFKGVPRMPMNFKDKIDLISYCLMPNHFHLLIRQKEKTTVTSFMTSIITRYSMYFNKKYNRVGSLFQGPYKAVLITNENQLLHLTRYIHLNPLEYTDNLIEAYSSYAAYLGIRKTKWIKPDIVLSYFNRQTAPEFIKTNSYKIFVEKYREESKNVLGELVLEDL